MLPLQNITQVITPVMHPIFSDFQNDKGKLLSSYERIVRFLAFIGLPLSVLLFFTAEEVTLIIFGDQWMPSVPVFRILSLSVGIQIILSSSGSIFQAAGDTRSLFVCGVFSSAFNVAGILLWHLPFRNPDSSGQLHCGDIHHQLHTVLLADVPGDLPAKCLAVHPSAYFSVGD